MGADAERHVFPMGLEVSDDARHARYREAMTPILASYGGGFGYDVVIAKVRKGNECVTCVFAISFPGSLDCDRFFADENYRVARAEFCAPAGASMILHASSKDNQAHGCRPMRRSKSVNLESERRFSYCGQTFSQTRERERSAYACSSHSKALSLFPNAA